MKFKILFLILSFILYPFTLSAQTIQYTFTLDWTPGSTNEDGFNIYRQGTKIGTAAKGAKQYKDPVSGSAGQQFCYEVSAYNTAGESAKSSQACGKIPAPAVVIPSPPTGLTTSALSQTSIQLSWADNSNNESGFAIERRSFQPEAVAQLKTVAAANNYTDRNLTTKKTYCYRVWANSAAGDSPSSNQSCSTTK